ncbi:MAG: helix-turn-helix domain-containing protein [Caldilineaceae bacterium]
MFAASTTSTAPLSAITNFGEFLKFLRRRAQMTQRELAIAVGYSISQISRLEQNERLPDEMTLLAVFVPALGLEKEPELVAQLMALAHNARALVETAPPSSPILEPTYPVAPAQPREEPTPHHNLPYPLTRLVGRAAEVAAIAQRVTTARLVTLTGVGGVGKTRLALAAAQWLVDAQPQKFPDGVWLVELAALHDAALVASTILGTFHLSVHPDRTPTDALLLYLQQKELLLLLDNCEHVIATCADLVERILHTCPKVTILATSREALNMESEVEWAVKPLSTPPLTPAQATPPTATQVGTFAAVQLFVERAQQVRADWQLTDQQAPAVAQICTHLDGIPLALELAAARLKGMTVEEIAAHLDDCFTLLSSGRRTALLRHQTLRAAIDWSYDLLSVPEQGLLQRLAVFAGGWTLAAAEALALPGQTRQQTLATLLQLVNKSLVLVDETGVESRYRLLETIRQYATEKLREADAADQARQTHFAYFLTLAEQSADVTLIGPRLSAWLNRVRLEYDNLRVAFAWACQQPDGGVSALRLAGGLGLFWAVRGEYSEGIRWLETALTYDQGASPAARALVLKHVAELGYMVGHPRPALLEEAYRLFTTAEACSGTVQCLHILGMAALYTAAAYDQAIAFFAQGLQISRTLAYPLATGILLWKLGDAYVAIGQAAQAIAAYAECIAIGRQFSERLLMARPLIMLVAVDRQRALQICQAELQQPQSDPETQAALLHTFGTILQEHQRLAEAKVALTEALGLWRTLNIKWSTNGGITRALLDLGLLCFWTHDDPTAARYMAEALQHYADVGDWHGVAWTQVILGNVALQQQQLQAAGDYFRASLRHSTDSSMNYLPLALCGMAATLQALGEPQRAFRLFGAATHFEATLFALNPSAAREFFVQALTHAREQLTDPALAAAWSAGQALTVEQAVAYALTE